MSESMGDFWRRKIGDFREGRIKECPVCKRASAPATPAATPLRESNQQRVDAAAQRVRQAMEKYRIDCTFRFRKDVELLIEIALAPVLEIFAAAQPAATPMADDERVCARCGHSYAQHTKGIRTYVDYCRHCPCPEWIEPAVAINESAPQNLPSAAQPQRESEQPEQALREALKSSMVALDDWLNIHASDHCDEQRVKEARQRVNEHGTIHYIGTVQDRNRAALSPQTDSQEPR